MIGDGSWITRRYSRPAAARGEVSLIPTLDEILTAIIDDAGEIEFDIGRMELGLGGGTQYFYRIFPLGGGDYVGGVVNVTASP
jgi:hypothetical protein